jgi:hypothetical protein
MTNAEGVLFCIGYALLLALTIAVVPLLSRAVVHRDRCHTRYGPESYQFRAAQRAVDVMKGPTERVVERMP